MVVCQLTDFSSGIRSEEFRSADPEWGFIQDIHDDPEEFYTRYFHSTLNTTIIPNIDLFQATIKTCRFFLAYLGEEMSLAELDMFSKSLAESAQHFRFHQTSTPGAFYKLSLYTLTQEQPVTLITRKRAFVITKLFEGSHYHCENKQILLASSLFLSAVEPQSAPSPPVKQFKPSFQQFLNWLQSTVSTLFINPQDLSRAASFISLIHEAYPGVASIAHEFDETIFGANMFYTFWFGNCST